MIASLTIRVRSAQNTEWKACMRKIRTIDDDLLSRADVKHTREVLTITLSASRSLIELRGDGRTVYNCCFV